jgi:hypothetical protein
MDSQAIINKGQAKKAGRKGAMAIGKRLGLGKKAQNLLGKAGEYGAGIAAEKARGKVRQLVGYQRGGVIVLKAKGGRRKK